jgi:hypothetical protein
MSEQHVPDFEDRLRTLLARAAEAIPADTDLSPRVYQTLARDSRGAGAGRVVGPRHVLATVAAVLVVALLAGVLTFLHPRGSLRPAGGVTGKATNTATTAPLPAIVPSTCAPQGVANPPASPVTATPVDHSVAVGRHASLNGITITIDRAYADATQTVITYHMQTNLNPPLPETPVLLDAHGHRYAMTSGDWDIQRGANYVFTPLPPEELGTPQTLTFFTQQMRLADPTGPGALVDGPWQISFSLTPALGTSVALSSTPLTRNGLTVQPLRLDTVPAGGGLDGATGGARVVARLSGLAPGMHLSDLSSFNTVFNLGGGGSSGCGGGALELVLPNGQQIMPGVVYLLGQPVPTTPAEQQAALAQTVGPSGTVDLEALFYTPIPAVTSLTLYVDHIAAQLAGAAKPTQVSGPWEFQLLPSA